VNIYATTEKRTGLSKSRTKTPTLIEYIEVYQVGSTNTRDSPGLQPLLNFLLDPDFQSLNLVAFFSFQVI